ncbi:MAG: glycoside hydrolase [Desulfatitalea sp.]|nr:glycoside hydrolase [Desulfatitalea sp.]MBI5895674.1 glycoside hydrolase [Desulfobacterales bacterium]
MAKAPAKESKVKRIDFSLNAPDAQAVLLVGTFNDWSLTRHPMKKDAQGLWKKTVMLAPGTYEYKFVVDGNWIEDPLNERRILNSFGSANSIVHVRK